MQNLHSTGFEPRISGSGINWATATALNILVPNDKANAHTTFVISIKDTQQKTICVFSLSGLKNVKCFFELGTCLKIISSVAAVIYLGMELSMT